jgi:hypothetical protein
VRFKSSTSSLLRLLDLGKPILAVEMPLTRELAAAGAPLLLYRDAEDLSVQVEALRRGSLSVPANRYPHTFATVAEAYVEAIRAALADAEINS